MSLQGISGAPATSVDPIKPPSPAAQAPGGAVDDDQDGGSTTQVSEGAQFLSKVQDLEKSDPARAKQVLTDLATKVRGQAKQGGAHADKLGALAEKLQKAAKTGDLSPLAKAKRRRGVRGGQGGQVQQAYAQQAQAAGPDLLSMLNTQLKSAGGAAAPPTSAKTPSAKLSVTA
jgi:hypothetical protein